MIIDVQGHAAYAYTGGLPFDASRPCVLFIHGALHDHSVWNLLARWAAHHGLSALAVDQPGHGRSTGPLQPHVEAIADWALALLDALQVPAAHWVGHSMGSLIALEAAARAPTRAISLGLVGTAYPMKVSDALLQAAEQRPEAGMAMVNTFSIGGWASKPGFPGPGTWLHGLNRALMGHVQSQTHAGQVFAHDFRLCNAYAHGLDAAATVTCPSLVLAGDADQMTPVKASRELAKVLKATVSVVSSGHAVMHEAPDATLAALRGLWGR